MKKRIEGVVVKDLKIIPDERGRLMEILRNDDGFFKGFGQVYMTTTYPGVVKAWHYHLLQDDVVCCVLGMIKLVLFDNREESPTYRQINEFYMGSHAPKAVVIPQRVYHGWKSISTEEALIINIPTQVYNYEQPDEYRLEPHANHIPYDWSRRDG